MPESVLFLWDFFHSPFREQKDRPPVLFYITAAQATHPDSSDSNPDIPAYLRLQALRSSCPDFRSERSRFRGRFHIW